MKAKTCRVSSWTCQLVRCGTGFNRGAGEKKILKPIRCIFVASKSSLVTIMSIIGLFFWDEIRGRGLRKWIGGSDTALSKAFEHKHKPPWTSRQKSWKEVNDFPQSLVYDCQEYLKQQVKNKIVIAHSCIPEGCSQITAVQKVFPNYEKRRLVRYYESWSMYKIEEPPWP